MHRVKEAGLTGGLESCKSIGGVKTLAVPQRVHWQGGGALIVIDRGSQGWNTGDARHAGSSDQVGHASPQFVYITIVIEHIT